MHENVNKTVIVLKVLYLNAENDISQKQNEKCSRAGILGGNGRVLSY